jgi:hypothetical protein
VQPDPSDLEYWLLKQALLPRVTFGADKKTPNTENGSVFLSNETQHHLSRQAQDKQTNFRFVSFSCLLACLLACSRTGEGVPSLEELVQLAAAAIAEEVRDRAPPRVITLCCQVSSHCNATHAGANDGAGGAGGGAGVVRPAG